MNKENIVQESNEWSKKELGSIYSVVNDGNDLTLLANGCYVAWFRDFEKGRFRFEAHNDDLSVELIKKDIIKKFYKKGIELLTKPEPKYTVHIIKNSADGFLNYKSSTGEWFLSDNQQGYGLTAQFTRSEIDDIKSNEDLAFDWNKAIIKEVKENEND